MPEKKTIKKKLPSRMGRPRIPKDQVLVPTSVGMTKNMREALAKRAKELGIKSRSQLIVAVAQYCLDNDIVFEDDIA